jgi:formate dehydrogenase major subunit
MANHWIDIKNADVILIIGANPAENHPVSFYWIAKAKENGATIVHIDPRYTRTSAQADIYISIRSGTDIAFLGGLIKYIIDNNLSNMEYVKNHTNAAFIVRNTFKLTEELDGVFSGYDELNKTYDKTTWQFEKNSDGTIKKDDTLNNDFTVYQLLKRHYKRYDLKTVSKITGIPPDELESVYRLYSSTGSPNKAGTVLYALGWTQHTTGTQIIRAMAIIQLLLGNMGIAGGGINALRGENNVQGATDHAILYNSLPGYLHIPLDNQNTLSKYLRDNTPSSKEKNSANWWSNYPKYFISLLKELYGDYANDRNEYCYNYLPKLDKGQDGSTTKIFELMEKGEIKGYFSWGSNQAVSEPDSKRIRNALCKLDWLVAVNLFDNETASFWQSPGFDSKSIQTEVFFLPCCSFIEKEGSITNSGRWAQWRYQAINPIGETKSDADIINELMFYVKSLYEKEGGTFPEPILQLNWDYGNIDENGKITYVDTSKVAKAINGHFLNDVIIENKTFKKGALVPDFTYLLDDGSTSCGNWLYSGSFSEDENKMKKRNNKDSSNIGLYSDWAWAWPLNRRILYNRASVDPYGQPLDETRVVIKWEDGRWIGDVPDGNYPPLKNEDGSENKDFKNVFIMNKEGVGNIFVNNLLDGPFPEHYEPIESPFDFNPIPKNKYRYNPAIILPHENNSSEYFAVNNEDYPYICTIFRVTEQWQSGNMTRNVPWLLELMPVQICEIGVELAKIKGIKNGDKITIESIRGKIEAVAVVTNRLKALKIMGKIIHQVGTLWCFGWQTPGKDKSIRIDSSNFLTHGITCPNTKTAETKTFMVNIKKIYD